MLKEDSLTDHTYAATDPQRDAATVMCPFFIASGGVMWNIPPLLVETNYQTGQLILVLPLSPSTYQQPVTCSFFFARPFEHAHVCRSSAITFYYCCYVLAMYLLYVQTTFYVRSLPFQFKCS